MEGEKTPKWRGPGGHDTDWATHVWPKGSLGTNNFFEINTTMLKAHYLTRRWANGPANCWWVCRHVVASYGMRVPGAGMWICLRLGMQLCCFHVPLTPMRVTCNYITLHYITLHYITFFFF